MLVQSHRVYNESPRDCLARSNHHEQFFLWNHQYIVSHETRRDCQATKDLVNIGIGESKESKEKNR